MCFSPEKDLKPLKINWVFMTVKPQMDIAITATHNFSFNFDCLFYHVWLIKDSEQPHHRKATDSGCPKAPLHHTHEAIIVQGASFIYSHLAFRKKNPRAKLALKNSCIVSLSKGRYWFGVLGWGFFVVVFCFFFIWVGFDFFPSLEQGLKLAVTLAVGCCSQPWAVASSSSRLLPRHREKAPVQPHHESSHCSTTVFYSVCPFWTLYAFHSTGFYTHTI